MTPRMDAPVEALAMSRAFASTAKALRPSVVRIDVEQERPTISRSSGGRKAFPALPDDQFPDFLKRFFGESMPDFPDIPQPGPTHGTGSGVILDSAGSIITNRHVIAGGGKLTVTMADGREMAAKVVGKDSRTDVAVIRLDSPPADLTVARLGDSDALQVGEWVLAIGSPLGLEQTVTAGIVSGKGHVGRGVRMSGERVRGYIQTDAKINPGNSGGPLVNLNGEVVGINTLISGGPGGSYGFAIPINEVRRIAVTLLKDGRIRYAYLGVMVGDLKALDAETRGKLGKGAPDKGAYVSEVTPGGPAAKAGIEAGDVITSIDGQKIEGGTDVVDYVSSRAIGSKVTIGYFRVGKSGSAQVTLGELPSGEDERASQPAGRVGVALQTLTPDLARSFGLDPTTKGALVAEVAPSSPAQKAGLAPGDVIVEIDRRVISSADDAVGALKTPRPGGHLLRVKGATGTRFVTVQAE